jgi:hypothetical protein
MSGILKGMDPAATPPRRRPAAVWVLIGVCAFQALSGLAGGFGLSLAPDGGTLQFPVSYLEGTPFDDYLVPGLILLVVLGIFPLVVVYGLLRRRAWGWWGAGVLGVGLLIWLAVEVVLVGERLYADAPGVSLAFWLGYGLVGGAIVALCLAPPVRRFYGT